MSLRKKPWNRVNLPVYSLCTTDANGHFNMNICTYVSAVSMQPKRMMVAVYHHTKTLENIGVQRTAVLQLLHADDYNLVNLLGKKSGNNLDKIARLEKRQLLREWESFPVLKNALAVMHLAVINQMEAGDHCMFLCEVTAYKNLNEGEVMTTKILGEKNIIRI